MFVLTFSQNIPFHRSNTTTFCLSCLQLNDKLYKANEQIKSMQERIRELENRVKCLEPMEIPSTPRESIVQTNDVSGCALSYPMMDALECHQISEDNQEFEESLLKPDLEELLTFEEATVSSEENFKAETATEHCKLNKFFLFFEQKVCQLIFPNCSIQM